MSLDSCQTESMKQLAFAKDIIHKCCPTIFDDFSKIKYRWIGRNSKSTLQKTPCSFIWARIAGKLSQSNNCILLQYTVVALSSSPAESYGMEYVTWHITDAQTSSNKVLRWAILMKDNLRFGLVWAKGQLV